MSEQKTPVVAPIVELQYLHSANVVQIDDFRVARGEAQRPYTECQHLNVNYSVSERRIWCRDCERDVEAFDAFMAIVQRYDHVEKRIAEFQRIEAETVRSRAVQALDKVYRSRTMVPCCPHCGRGILARDVLGGLRRMDKQIEERRRCANKER